LIEDVYLPLEKGLDTVINKKNLVTMKIKLTRDVNEVDIDSIGYEAPI